jgi:hypothetical protein
MSQWTELDNGGIIPMNATDQLAPSFTSQPNQRPASMVAGGAVRTGDWPQFLRDQPTVTMIFEQDVSLNLDDYAGLVHFKKGVAEVPESLVGHWYLKRYAKPYVKPAALAEPGPEEMAQKLRDAGFEVSVRPHTDFAPQAAASIQGGPESLLPKVVDAPKEAHRAAAKRQKQHRA